MVRDKLTALSVLVSAALISATWYLVESGKRDLGRFTVSGGSLVPTIVIDTKTGHAWRYYKNGDQSEGLTRLTYDK